MGTGLEDLSMSFCRFSTTKITNLIVPQDHTTLPGGHGWIFLWERGSGPRTASYVTENSRELN